MNPRYEFLIAQYIKVETVYTGISLIAIYLPVMGHLLDVLLRGKARRWLEVWKVFSLVIYVAFLLYCGWINRGG